MWFSGTEVIPVEPTDVVPFTIPNVLQTIYDIVSTIGEIVKNLAQSTVEFISDIPDVIAHISVLFELLPPTIKAFGIASMAFVVFRFALAYSKGYGQ